MKNTTIRNRLNAHNNGVLLVSITRAGGNYSLSIIIVCLVIFCRFSIQINFTEHGDTVGGAALCRRRKEEQRRLRRYD